MENTHEDLPRPILKVRWASDIPKMENTYKGLNRRISMVRRDSDFPKMKKTHENLPRPILKVRWGNDIRKVYLIHDKIAHFELLHDIETLFGRDLKDWMILKYKDQDGDLVTLGTDDGLLLALETVGAELDVTVTSHLDDSIVPHSRSHELVSDEQRKMEQLKVDVEKLFDDLSSLATEIEKTFSASVAPIHENIVLQKSYEAPPSPVPSEKPELPATIDPSIQEQADNRPAHLLILRRRSH